MDHRHAMAICGALLALSTVDAAQAQDIPNWQPRQICQEDSARGQCMLFEQRARSRVGAAWPTLPDAIRKGCLAEFRAPLEPSWRIMSDCIGELSVAARIAARRGAIARDIAVAEQLQARRREAERAARRRAERERQTAAAREERQRLAKAAEAERARIAREEASFMAGLTAEREAAQAAAREAQLQRERAAREQEEIRLAREEASFLTAFAVLKKQERLAIAEPSTRTGAAPGAASAYGGPSQQSPEPLRADTALGIAGTPLLSRAKPAAGGVSADQEQVAALPARPETLSVERPAQPARKAERTAVTRTAAGAERSQAVTECEQRLANTAAAGAVRFAFDSAELLKDAEITLDALAAGARACGKLAVTIEGHTDATGTHAYNQRLSEQRAQNVANYLINAGVASERVRYIGYGEERPVAPNSSTEGRALNRRIEYKVR
jgi:outer membrane protein OmpA-like peptidoglycan-associated protein